MSRQDTARFLQAAIVTVSDRAHAGEREDRGGPLLAECMREAGFTVTAATVVPDDMEAIRTTLTDLVSCHTPLVLTTGGTGAGPRDVTPEATRSVIDREMPGLAEEIRRQGLAQTRYSLLSRGIAGIRERTLIINLPGKPEGAVAAVRSVLDVLPHALAVLCSPRFDHG
ncbi:MAG: MogA/MoaB family molybdenum cofactor biosynthesis protein [Bacilli bacterium]